MRDAIVDGERFRACRHRAGLYQRELGERVLNANGNPTSTSFIKLIEAGRTQPGDALAHKLARAMGCAVEDFSTPKQQSSESAA